eukprot:TRINITY_DN1685_c0_g2_i1.p1 TRINITY_DN1685_c0_g2~~TRINITY_DN1685_c0_g2_i1.p1  ORF type:complete len:398 (+),score=71.30 TRINITY_DN1685_c0_g2_i1:99-1292(+)
MTMGTRRWYFLTVMISVQVVGVILLFWSTGSGNDVQQEHTPLPLPLPVTTIKIDKPQIKATELASSSSSLSTCSKPLERDITIAENKHQYICQYMPEAKQSSGTCTLRCPEMGNKKCIIRVKPSGDDFRKSDAVVYHPGRNLPIEKGHPSQWSVMWYGESQEKHPEKYTEEYLAKYDAHVVFKNWSKYRFTWAQRYWSDFKDIQKVKKQWVPWSQRRTAVAIVSNCKYHTTNRSAVMQEIDRLLQLRGDKLYFFGKCHPGRGKDNLQKEHPSCSKTSDRYKEKICVFRNYKYVVAMDNSIDDDYVTEKIYHALLAGAVPVYAGAPNVQNYIPMSSAAVLIDPKGSLSPVVDQMLDAKSPPPETAWWSEPFSAEFLNNSDIPNPACTICQSIYCGRRP